MLVEILWSSEDLGKISKPDQGEMKDGIEELMEVDQRRGCRKLRKRNPIIQRERRKSAEGKCVEGQH